MYTAPNKSESGWIGPAKVLDTDFIPTDGMVWVKYMNNALRCRVADVRAHLAELSLFCSLFAADDPFNVVFDFLERLPTATSVTLIAHQVQHRWELSKKARDLKSLYEAVLFVGNVRFGINNCVGARLLKGRQRLPGLGLPSITEAPIYFYEPPNRDDYHVYHLQEPHMTVDLHDIIQKEDPGPDYCFIQFVGVSSEAKAEAVKYITDVPCLAGQGTPDLSSPRSSIASATLESEPGPDLLTRPHLANNDCLEQDEQGPPRCCPKKQGTGPLCGEPSLQQDDTGEAAYFLQKYGPSMMPKDIP